MRETTATQGRGLTAVTFPFVCFTHVDAVLLAGSPGAYGLSLVVAARQFLLPPARPDCLGFSPFLIPRASGLDLERIN